MVSQTVVDASASFLDDGSKTQSGNLPAKGLYYDAMGNPSQYPPGTFGFCTSPTQAEYERYKETRELPPWNPGRHKDAKNPLQCEVAFMDDLANMRGYRENPFSIGKNVLAGIVNSVVPGSDLGDADSSGQLLGQAIGTFGSLFVNPGKALTTALTSGLNKVGLGTFISKASAAVTKLANTGVGKIVGSIGSQYAQAYVQQQFAPKASAIQQASGSVGTIAGEVEPGMVRNFSAEEIRKKIDEELKRDKPNYLPWIIGGGLLLVLLMKKK